MEYGPLCTCTLLVDEGISNYLITKDHPQTRKKQKTVHIDSLDRIFGPVKINTLYLAASFTGLRPEKSQRLICVRCPHAHCRFAQGSEWGRCLVNGFFDRTTWQSGEELRFCP